MKRTHLILAALTLLAATAATGAISEETPRTLELILDHYGIRFNTEEQWPVLKHLVYPVRDSVVRSIIAQTNKARIELEITRPVTETDATGYIRSKYALINSLYQAQFVPYTGNITYASDCPPRNKPKEIPVTVAGNASKILVAGASARFVLGACEDELIKQMAAFIIWYDPRTKTVFQMTFFQPARSFHVNNLLQLLKGL